MTESTIIHLQMHWRQFSRLKQTWQSSIQLLLLSRLQEKRVKEEENYKSRDETSPPGRNRGRREAGADVGSQRSHGEEEAGGEGGHYCMTNTSSSLLLSLRRPRGSARRWWHCVLTPRRVTAASSQPPPTPRWWGGKWRWPPYERGVYLSRHALTHSSSPRPGSQRETTSRLFMKPLFKSITGSQKFISIGV